MFSTVTILVERVSMLRNKAERPTTSKNHSQGHAAVHMGQSLIHINIQNYYFFIMNVILLIIVKSQVVFLRPSRKTFLMP